MVSPLLPLSIGALMSRNEIVDKQDELTGQIVDTVSENYFAKSSDEKTRLKNVDKIYKHFNAAKGELEIKNMRADKWNPAVLPSPSAVLTQFPARIALHLAASFHNEPQLRQEYSAVFGSLSVHMTCDHFKSWE